MAVEDMIYVTLLAFALLVFALHDWWPLIGGVALFGLGLALGVWLR